MSGVPAVSWPTVLGVVLAVPFAALGVAKLARTASMLARAEHVGFSARSYQLIGAAELAGAAGVLAGSSFPPLGYAAGAGLFALLGGALVTHVRNGDGGAELAPAVGFAACILVYLLVLGAAR